jgi:hypothetical protein
MPATLISSLHPAGRCQTLASAGRGFTRSLVRMTGFDPLLPLVNVRSPVSQFGDGRCGYSGRFILRSSDP